MAPAEALILKRSFEMTAMTLFLCPTDMLRSEWATHVVMRPSSREEGGSEGRGLTQASSRHSILIGSLAWTMAEERVLEISAA